MKQYQSNKIVSAARIVSLLDSPPSKFHPLGCIEITLDDKSTFYEMGERFEKASIGQYFVIYEDGYKSVNPDLKGYTEIDNSPKTGGQVHVSSALPSIPTAADTMDRAQIAALGEFVKTGVAFERVQMNVTAEGIAQIETTAIKTADIYPAPRVTLEDIHAAIASEHYFTAQQGVVGAFLAAAGDAREDSMENPLRLLTFCVLVLNNGFTVVGKSACVSAANFDADLGRKYAHEDAINQCWPLMGFALADRLHRARTE